MKRIIALTAVALITTVGAASAMTSPSSVELNEIRGYAPNADLSGLSNGDIAALQSIIHGGDSEGEATAQIRAYLLNAS